MSKIIRFMRWGVGLPLFVLLLALLGLSRLVWAALDGVLPDNLWEQEENDELRDF